MFSLTNATNFFADENWATIIYRSHLKACFTVNMQMLAVNSKTINQ